jgi:putative endonuclease
MSQRDYEFFVYILSNRSHTLYIGVTNNLRVRVLQHRQETSKAFTTRYKITRLIYFERFQYIDKAIVREKELKHWTRARKIALIESRNSTWAELMPNTVIPALVNKAQLPYGTDNKKEQGTNV